MGGDKEWWASQGLVHPAIRAQTVALCPQKTTEMYTVYRIGRDRYWQQFDTTSILISAPQWLHRLYNAPWQFYRIGKKLSVKADLDTNLMFLDAGCMGVSLILGIELNFSTCANWDSFCKSSHIYHLHY